jgi:hypothetical protein
MKKIIYILLGITIVTSCNDDLTDMNDNPKLSTEAPAPTVFSNAERNLVDALTTPNVNSNIFRLLSQQWTETTYTDESRYDLSTRNIPQNFWNAIYRDVIGDLRETKRIIENADTTFSDPVANNNQWQIAEILEVYAWSVLETTYGDIPYSQAIDIENVFPAYEDDQVIHNDLINRLDAAVSNLNLEGESFGNADFIYEGDLQQWTKFANSLKLRLGMMLADVDLPRATTVVQEAVAGGVFESNEDNAVFEYLESPPNTNPIWVNLVQSGRKDFVVANTIVDIMNDLDDPRRASFFTTVDTVAYDAYDENGDPAEGATALDTVSVYYGGIYGSSNSYSTFSKPSETITDPTFPSALIDYAEVEFLLAEAVERGMNVGGTAEEHYNNAITASITDWGGTEEDAQAYLAQPEVAYATAGDEWREKIGTQKWIALFNRGHEAWTEYRRLDAPNLNEVANPVAAFPLRFPYPVGEQNLNTANYEAAASAIGGDLPTTRLFWDVNAE